MQYQSPIKVLSSFLNEGEDFSKTDLNILKRRILAEFELSGNSTISTGEGEFSKNDILAIFEKQKTSDDFQYHLMIAGMPDILEFLEYNYVETIIKFDSPLFSDNKFLNFISPYLANSLGNFFAACILNPEFNVKNALQQSYPILPEHETYLLEPVYSAVDEIITAIEEIKPTLPSKENIPQAVSYFGHARIRVFNLLPQKYFTTAIDLYGSCGIDFIVEYLEKSGSRVVYNDDIKFIFRQMQKLQISGNVKSKIAAIEEFMSGYQSKAETSSSSSGAGRFVFFIIFVVITVLRLALSDSHSSRYNNYQDYSNNQDLQEILKNSKFLTDSVYKLQKEGIKSMHLDSNLRKILKTIDTTSINKRKSASDTLRTKHLKKKQKQEEIEDKPIPVKFE
jgi:hypothetical protein